MSENARLEELCKSFSEEPIVNTPVRFDFKLDSLTKGLAVGRMKVTSEMLVGRVGIVNGSIMDAPANTLGVYAAMSVIPEGHTPRINFSVNNIGKAFAGETLYIFARVINENRYSIVVSFSVVGENTGDVKTIGQALYLKPHKTG